MLFGEFFHIFHNAFEISAASVSFRMFKIFMHTAQNFYEKFYTYTDCTKIKKFFVFCDF